MLKTTNHFSHFMWNVNCDFDSISTCAINTYMLCAKHHISMWMCLYVILTFWLFSFNAICLLCYSNIFSTLNFRFLILAVDVFSWSILSFMYPTLSSCIFFLVSLSLGLPCSFIAHSFLLWYWLPDFLSKSKFDVEFFFSFPSVSNHKTFYISFYAFFFAKHVLSCVVCLVYSFNQIAIAIPLAIANVSTYFWLVVLCLQIFSFYFRRCTCFIRLNLDNVNGNSLMHTKSTKTYRNGVGNWVQHAEN